MEHVERTLPSAAVDLDVAVDLDSALREQRGVGTHRGRAALQRRVSLSE